MAGRKPDDAEQPILPGGALPNCHEGGAVHGKTIVIKTEDPFTHQVLIEARCGTCGKVLKGRRKKN